MLLLPDQGFYETFRTFTVVNHKTISHVSSLSLSATTLKPGSVMGDERVTFLFNKSPRPTEGHVVRRLRRLTRFPIKWTQFQRRLTFACAEMKRLVGTCDPELCLHTWWRSLRELSAAPVVPVDPHTQTLRGVTEASNNSYQPVIIAVKCVGKISNSSASTAQWSEGLDRRRRSCCSRQSEPRARHLVMIM